MEDEIEIYKKKKRGKGNDSNGVKAGGVVFVK